ncbi:MAG: stage II sporulation protein R [Ruminococcaceae bacterium]|nr:stage II sporulation protein R [Oscillospiraceae bacterium]
MKMFMKILMSSVLITVLMSAVALESTCSELKDDVLRLHILANSDTFYDQELKIKVRDSILNEISPLYDGVTTKEKAIAVTSENLDVITKVASKVIAQNNSDYSVTAEIAKEYFDTRYYDDFTMPAGMYDTLLIKIGEGNGKNWWCVMYPTLCVGASSDLAMKENLSDDAYKLITEDEYVFKFKFIEYFEKISKLFS